MRRLAAVVRDANEAITVQDLEGWILAGIRARKGCTAGAKQKPWR